METNDDLLERRRAIAACHSVIARRHEFLAMVAGSADPAEAREAVAAAFGFSDDQIDTVMSLQVRHFSATYQERFAEHLAALDELIGGPET